MSSRGPQRARDDLPNPFATGRPGFEDLSTAGASKALFRRDSTTLYTTATLAAASILLIAIEANTRFLDPVRSAVAILADPVYYVAETPHFLGNLVEDLSNSAQEVQRLERRVLELSLVAQQALATRTENNRLRELLGSRPRVSGQVLVTELIGVVPDPGKHRVLIDKGTADGVSVGAAVVDSQGLFGQVIEVSRASSVVLLVTDPTHATPVEVSRNNLRSIATGVGRYDWMELEAVPFSADIRRGDLVVSSGLGGRFPRGYPVGEVAEVERNPTARFATVRVRPSAALNRSRHVLVVFPDTFPDTAPEGAPAGAPAGAGEAG